MLTDHNGTIGEHLYTILGEGPIEQFIPTSVTGEEASQVLDTNTTSPSQTAILNDAGAGLGAGKEPGSVIVTGTDEGVPLALQVQDFLVGIFEAAGRTAAATTATARRATATAGAAGMTTATTMMFGLFLGFLTSQGKGDGQGEDDKELFDHFLVGCLGLWVGWSAKNVV